MYQPSLQELISDPVAVRMKARQQLYAVLEQKDPKVAAARRAADDLEDRCAGREMTRDETRLMARYRKTLDPFERKNLERYRAILAEQSRAAKAAFAELPKEHTTDEP